MPWSAVLGHVATPLNFAMVQRRLCGLHYTVRTSALVLRQRPRTPGSGCPVSPPVPRRD